VALRRQGDDVGALQLFQQAQQLDQSPRSVAQMGLAEQALGRWVPASEHLQQALASPNDKWIRKNLALINGALAKVADHIGHLEIRGGTAGAEVRIEGVKRGTLPLKEPLAVPTGKVTIDVSLSGYNPIQRLTMVGAREHIRETLEPLVSASLSERPAPGPARTTPPPLAPTPVALAAAEPAPAAEPATTARADAPVLVAHSDSGASQRSSLRPAAKWAAWGVGTAALAVGIVGALKQGSAGKDFDRGCALDPAENVVPLPGSSQTAAGCSSLKSKVDSYFALEVGGFVAAGALAATGLILWLTEPAPAGGAPAADRAALACSPGLMGARGPWMSCALHF
jgi:hypothetical protein